MLLNKHFSKNIITISILSFLTGSVYAKDNSINGVRLSNDEITSNSTYSDKTNLYIDTNHKIQNITLENEAILQMNGDSLAIGTIVKDDANISMYAHGIKDVGIPTIKDTVVTGTSNIDMNANSSSIGKLFIDKSAELYIDNIDTETTDVSKNDPVPSANIFIENLTLAGKTYIVPSWNEIYGDDGDAPRPEKPGSELITHINNLEMQAGSQLEMDYYASGMQFNRLELKTLTGEGTFILTSRLADGLSDNIYISDHATGHFGLKINDSGEEISDPKNVQLVYVNSGDASFNLLNKGGNVEVGVWKYKLNSKTNDGHTEWYLIGGKDGESDISKQPDT
ncbi:TPA: pertactin-like passenger domain-containing protein, partial [Proteus mirabilis]